MDAIISPGSSPLPRLFTAILSTLPENTLDWGFRNCGWGEGEVGFSSRMKMIKIESMCGRD